MAILDGYQQRCSDIPQQLVALVSIMPGWVPKRFKYIFWGFEEEQQEEMNRFSCLSCRNGALSLNNVVSLPPGRSICHGGAARILAVSANLFRCFSNQFYF